MTETVGELLQRRLDEIRDSYRHVPITRRLLETLLAETFEEVLRLRQDGLVNQLHVAVRRAPDDDHAIDVWVGELDHPGRPDWVTRKATGTLSRGTP